MCLGFMSYRAPSAALKQINYNNSPNTRSIINYFQCLFMLIKCHILVIFSEHFNVFCLFYRHASFFQFFLFLDKNYILIIYSVTIY